MAINYTELLRNPKVRKLLGRRRLVRAEEDEDFLPDFLADNETEVLTLGWDGTTAGAIWVTQWAGLYFFRSSDYDSEGPFTRPDEALCDERLWTETSNPELTSDVLPLKQLLEMGKALAGQQGEAVFINGTKYVLRRDVLVEEAE